MCRLLRYKEGDDPWPWPISKSQSVELVTKYLQFEIEKLDEIRKFYTSRIQIGRTGFLQSEVQ